MWPDSYKNTKASLLRLAPPFIFSVFFFPSLLFVVRLLVCCPVNFVAPLFFIDFLFHFVRLCFVVVLLCCPSVPLCSSLLLPFCFIVSLFCGSSLLLCCPSLFAPLSFFDLLSIRRVPVSINHLRGSRPTGNEISPRNGKEARKNCEA